jgi:molybdopterin molybdotransferase
VGQRILSDCGELQTAVDWRGFNHLTPVSQALTALAACCVEIAPVEMGIENAAERIVAAPIRAPIAVPPSPIALGDGWAVAAQDTLGASCYAPGFANRPPRRVACGNLLPDHADAVLPLPGVNALSCPIEILSPAAPGEGVRATGSDFAAGEVIVAAGAKLRPDHIALFRLAGIDKVSLRIPRVAIVSCGDLGRVDRVGAWVAAMSTKEGAECCLHATDMAVPDNLAEATTADFIIMIGAFGSGYPIVQTLASAGGVVAHGIAIRPGETMGCGFLQTGSAQNFVPVVFVPERIESVLAAWLLLARPCLRRLAGATDLDHGEELPLKRKIVSNPGMSDLVLLRHTTESGSSRMWQPLATGDIPWAAIAHADAWLLVAPECEGYAAGQNVFAQFL